MCWESKAHSNLQGDNRNCSVSVDGMGTHQVFCALQWRSESCEGFVELGALLLSQLPHVIAFGAVLVRVHNHLELLERLLQLPQVYVVVLLPAPSTLAVSWQWSSSLLIQTWLSDPTAIMICVDSTC